MTSYPVTFSLPFTDNTRETFCNTVLNFMKNRALPELTPLDTPIVPSQTHHIYEVISDLIERHPQILFIHSIGKNLIIQEVEESRIIDPELQTVMLANNLNTMSYLIMKKAL